MLNKTPIYEPDFQTFAEFIVPTKRRNHWIDDPSNKLSQLSEKRVKLGVNPAHYKVPRTVDVPGGKKSYQAREGIGCITLADYFLQNIFDDIGGGSDLEMTDEDIGRIEGAEDDDGEEPPLDDRYGADGHPNSAMRAFAGDENLFQNDSEPVFQPDPPQPPGNPGDAKIDPRKKGW